MSKLKKTLIEGLRVMETDGVDFYLSDREYKLEIRQAADEFIQVSSRFIGDKHWEIEHTMGPGNVENAVRYIEVLELALLQMGS